MPVATECKVFVDGDGFAHTLDPAHRASVRIESQTGYGKSVGCCAPDDAIVSQLKAVEARVRLGDTLLRTFGGGVEGCRVLNVGASAGFEAACLAGLGAGSVVGSDYGEHFIGTRGTDQCKGLGELPERQQRAVSVFREHVGEFGFNASSANTAVEFVQDDLAASNLDDDSFDCICSWATLEHVMDPASAMRETRRLLSPGGFAYHEYNPFFCIDGGHSAATLDFPWGHLRLNTADFRRYVEQAHADDCKWRVDFYRRGINRMTQSMLVEYARSAGLEVLAVIPRTRTEDLVLLTDVIIEQSRRHYPGLSINDLVSRIVRVVLRRPEHR